MDKRTFFFQSVIAFAAAGHPTKSAIESAALLLRQIENEGLFASPESFRNPDGSLLNLG